MAGAPLENATMAVYGSPAQVAAALENLRQAGFAVSKVSVAGANRRQAGREVLGCYGSGGRAAYWGDTAGFWGALWGTLSGWAFFCFPDIGPVLVAGPLSGWVVAVLKNSQIFSNLSAFGAALYSIGIPRDRIPEYETALEEGNFLVLVHGPAGEVARAREILGAVPVSIRDC